MTDATDGKPSKAAQLRPVKIDLDLEEPASDSVGASSEVVQPVIFTRQMLSDLRHQSESSRYYLAVTTCIVVGFILFVMSIVFLGAVLAIALLVVLPVWYGLQVAKATFIANNIRVSSDNFPEIYAAKERIRRQLSYRSDIEIFIVEEGSVNAFLAKFFGAKFIVLNSGMVDNLHSPSGRKQMEFVVARFIGALKARHMRLGVFRVLVTGLEKLRIFNLLLLPFERAVQYTGDQIGLAVVEDLQACADVMSRLMVGNSLYSRVNPAGIQYQVDDIHGYFAFISRIISTHPPVIRRYCNLMTFAAARYPASHATFVREKLSELRAEGPEGRG